MNIPNFIYTGAGFKYRSPDSHRLVSEPIEIDLINLQPAPNPYTLFHPQTQVMTISYVNKFKDPETLRETVLNHTFFLPLTSVMNEYKTRLKCHVGKEGSVNV